jgi:hypothetical protein
LPFDTKSQAKSSQIARPFLWPFLQTFGLGYSPLNSATLSCSSEVTLIPLSRAGKDVDVTISNDVEDESFVEVVDK